MLDHVHRGIRFELALAEKPDVWRWSFTLNGRRQAGATQTRIEAMAERRVRTRIDRELKLAVDRGGPIDRVKCTAEEPLSRVRDRLGGSHAEICVGIERDGPSWRVVFEVGSR